MMEGVCVVRRPSTAEGAPRSQSNLADGGAAKLERDKKMFVRDRVALLVDEGSFVEDGLLANAPRADLPADGVVTGVGQRRRAVPSSSSPTTRW